MGSEQLRRRVDAPTNDDTAVLTSEADVLHALLVQRADALTGCTQGSQEELALAAISDTIEHYEAGRWPNGKTEAGEG